MTRRGRRLPFRTGGSTSSFPGRPGTVAVLTAALLCILGFGRTTAAGRDLMTVQVTPSVVELGVLTPVNQLDNVEHNLDREFPDALTLHLEAERSCVIQVKAEGVRHLGAGTSVQGDPAIPIDRLAWRIGSGAYVPLSREFVTMLVSPRTGPHGTDVPVDLRFTVKNSDSPVHQAFRLKFRVRPPGEDEQDDGDDRNRDAQSTRQAGREEVVVQFELGEWLRLVVETPSADGRVEFQSTANPDHQPYADGPGASAVVKVAGNVNWKLWEGLGDNLKDRADTTKQIPRGSLEWLVDSPGGVSWSATATTWIPFTTPASLLARGGATYREPDGWARIPLRFRLKQSWLIRPGTYQTPTLWVAAEP